MRPPEIENSTREESEAVIREMFHYKSVDKVNKDGRSAFEDMMP